MQSPYLNKHLLVVLDYLDPAGQPKKKVEVYGVITRISDEDGIFIEQANGKGEFKLALSPDSLRKAQPGTYKLASSGETVVDPDYVVKRTFNAHLPADKAPLMGTFGGEMGNKDFQLPKICAHCGTRTESLRLWELSSTHRGSAGRFATMAVFAGIHVSRVTTYTFKVPVCKACAARLAKLITLRQYIIGASLALFALCLVLTMLLGVANRERTPALNVAGALTQIFLIVAVVAYLAFRNLGHRFGRFNFRGGGFKFRNPDFQKAFAILNPTQVKRAAKK